MESDPIFAEAGAVLGGSLLFFFVTNGAVWLFAEGSIYPKTLAGLATCYWMALPFFRNTVASDLLFSAAFFGVPVALAAMKKIRQAHPKAHISLLTTPPFEGLAKASPYFNAVFTDGRPEKTALK